MQKLTTKYKSEFYQFYLSYQYLLLKPNNYPAQGFDIYLPRKVAIRMVFVYCKTSKFQCGEIPLTIRFQKTTQPHFPGEKNCPKPGQFNKTNLQLKHAIDYGVITSNTWL